MTIEAGVVITKLGCLWHLPPGRSSVYLPDSPDLWQQLWDNREILQGFAHSHPGKGREACQPSAEDITTFDAIERALGRQLRWWICSADCLVEYHRCNPDLLAYPAIMDWSPYHDFPHHCTPTPPIWVHVLREISGHYFSKFQCVGCQAPCDMDTREPILGWGLEGGSVCPGPWSENREFKTIAMTCVYCDENEDYKRTGRVPKKPAPRPPRPNRDLDRRGEVQGTHRQTSGYRNDTCTVWDKDLGLWVESDDHLRAAIMEKLK